MNTASIISRITQLKAEGAESLQSQQLSVIPHPAIGLRYKQIQYYLYDSVRTIVEQKTTVGIKIEGLKLNRPFSTTTSVIEGNDPIWVNDKLDSYDGNLLTLVNAKKIYPFILFINGRFIKLSTVRLVCSDGVYNLLITPTSSTILNAIRVVKTISIYEMGLGAEYTEGTINPSNSSFAFNEDGGYDYTSTSITGASINLANSNINQQIITFTGTDVGSSIVFDASKQYTLNNAFVFDRTDQSSEYLFDSDSGIEIDGSYFTLPVANRGIKDSYAIKVLYNVESGATNDILNKVSSSYISSEVTSYRASGTRSELLTNLERKFDVTTIASTKSLDDNIRDAVAEISQYDNSLFDDLYSSDSNMEIVERTGAWCTSHADSNNVLYMPRRCSKSGLMDDSYCIMLVNGKLYDYYRLVKHQTHQVAIPLISINATDKIEFWWFKNVNNNSYTITVTEADDYVNIDENYLNNMLLFTKTNYDTYFTFPDDGQQMFPVEYTVDKNSSGYSKIQLTNTALYGTELTQVYKYRFKYATMYASASDITDVNGADFVFNLDSGTFNMCNDYNRYLVFVNGRKIGSDQYRMTLPVRTTTPFMKYQIFITIPLHEEDRVEVFYLPCIMTDVLTQENLSNTGDIIVEKSALGYNFNKNLYMIFLNGKKIPKDDIADIGAGRMRIISDEQSTSSICATKIIPDDEYLSAFFASNISLWESILASKTDEEISTLLGITGTTITNTETSIFEDNIPIITVMWQLIRDCYMMNAGVDISQPFIYDYQDIDSSIPADGQGIDTNNDLVIDAANAERTDYLIPESDPTIPA